ncbi:MAG: hypothetical protein CMB99_16550 [Flavobacteriaceae bacterium]|jgi:hypothetical protein|nr:hypothetical protein [Flavobacteriaceae bacterium]|tara:strand:+ start:346 stop:723 length:378 start_codon:yes stop_codon:yes gene_type:complete
MATSPILGIPLVSNQQSQPEVTVNESILLLQIALMGCIQLGVNTPPTGSDGDTYVIGAAPTGAWSGQANKIATYYNDAWLFLPGVDDNGSNIAMGSDQAGMRIFDNYSDAIYVWDGAAWNEYPTP